MKTGMFVLALALGTASYSLATPQTAGQDIKDAGRKTKNAAKKGTAATADGAQKATHATVHGVKKGTHKAAAATADGANKLKDKTTTKP